MPHRGVGRLWYYRNCRKIEQNLFFHSKSLCWHRFEMTSGFIPELVMAWMASSQTLEINLGFLIPSRLIDFN